MKIINKRALITEINNRKDFNFGKYEIEEVIEFESRRFKSSTKTF